MEPLLILAGGLLGSSHCVGMCGGFALLLGAGGDGGWRSGLSRQLIYSAGRIATYAFLGAVAGFAGARLVASVPSIVNAAAVLSIVAGLLLVGQGLVSAGLVPWRTGANGSPCAIVPLLRSYLSSPSAAGVFLAGVATGFLPCGLVYAFLALAASTGRLELGLATMTLFGLGTVPLMVATGVGGRMLSLAMRQRVLKVAAVCVVVTGVLTIVRGAGFLGTTTDEDPACPFCSESSVTSIESGATP